MNLYPFQQTGAVWLADRDRALLGDEMGLGKTPQAIRAADEIGADTILVVCKAIGREMWRTEFGRWHSAPTLAEGAEILYPGRRWRQTPGRLQIVNYDVIHRPDVLRRLLKRRWDLIIFDEMHSLKGGDQSRRGQAALDPTRGLWTRADVVWGLSGTPAPNHPGELFPWLRALHPELVEGLDQEGFIRRYCFYKDTPYGTRVTGIRDLPGIRKLLNGIMLRRKRTEVLPELPLLQVDQLILSHKEALPAFVRDTEATDEARRVKALLQALGPDADIEDLMAEAELDLSELRRLYGLAKVPLIVQQVEDELAGGQDKIVVFGWHRDVLIQLKEKLQHHDPVMVIGGTHPRAMQDAVDSFQNDPNCRLFLGNILSAGTTITLTAANRLIFAEYSWTPADNEQAMLRILRIGQDRPCRVSYASLSGSLDQAITSVFTRKAQILSQTFDPKVSDMPTDTATQRGTLTT